MRFGHMCTACLAAGCLVLATGCKDNATEPSDHEQPPADVVLATPDNVIEYFVQTYEDMDLAAYRDHLLSPDFRFYVGDSTVQEFGLPSRYFDATADVALQERMFSGMPSNDPNHFSGIISSIDISVLTQFDTWHAVATDTEYFGDVPGALGCTYSIDAYFHLQGQSRQLYVTGLVAFYVAPRDSTADGGYRLLGVEDHTDHNKAVESINWGSVKALYLPD